MFGSLRDPPIQTTPFRLPALPVYFLPVRREDGKESFNNEGSLFLRVSFSNAYAL